MLGNKISALKLIVTFLVGKLSVIVEALIDSRQTFQLTCFSWVTPKVHPLTHVGWPVTHIWRGCGKRQSFTLIQSVTGYTISGNFRGRKLAILRRNSRELLAFTVPRMLYAPKFCRENFCKQPQNREICESYPPSQAEILRIYTIRVPER